MYVTCASQFGWDKEQVDRQPFKYVKRVLLMLKDEYDQMNKPKLRGVPIGEQSKDIQFKPPKNLNKKPRKQKKVRRSR